MVLTALGASAAEGTVVRVVDGDTVDINVDGEVTRIRLLNIDAPESVDPNTEIECLGPEASNKLRTLLPAGAAVELRYDKERVDRYGRTLAAVFNHGRLVNAEMARAGLAIPLTVGSNDAYRADVDAAYAAAATSQVGLFASTIECTIPGQVEALQQSGPTMADPSALATPEDAETAAVEALAVVTAADALSQVIDSRSTFVSRALTASSRSAALQVVDEIRESASRIHESARERASAIRAERAAEAEARAAARAKAAAVAKAKAKAAKAKAAAEAKARAEASASAKAEARAAASRLQSSASPPRSSNRTGSSSSSSRPSGSNPSGYTGCRRYAPGGKTWTPIPCP